MMAPAWDMPPCRKLLVAVGFMGMLVICGTGPASAEEPVILDSKIPLGDVRGRIDHLAVDLARQRLFIAELGNDSSGIVDLAGRKLLRRVAGLKEPTGVGYVPATDTVFVASGAAGSVYRYAGGDPTRISDTARR